MKKIVIIILILYSLINISSEIIIKNDSKVLKGKIIKMDEDTITLISSKSEVIIDKEEIAKIYYNEKEYEDDIARIKQNEDKAFRRTGNLIFDGNFDEGYPSENWQMWSLFSTKSLKVENGELLFLIWKNTNRSNAELSYNFLSIEKDKTYQIKFNARAANSVILNISLEQSYKPYKRLHIIKGFRMTEKMKVYTYTFKMKDETEDHARLKFFINSTNNIIYFDDIEIIQIDQ